MTGTAHVLLATAPGAVELVRAHAYVTLAGLEDVLAGVLQHPHIDLIGEALLVEVPLLRGNPVLQPAVRRNTKLSHRSSVVPAACQVRDRQVSLRDEA